MDLLIRTMQQADLAFALACTAGEGWLSENLTTLEGFLLNDPQGCLVAEENGRPIGICIATSYGKSGFIGELIVRQEARGNGVGTALLNYGVSILRNRGAETVFLDGVLKAVDLYERNGFRKICRSWRFLGNLAGRSHPNVRSMISGDLDMVAALDRNSFGADRHFFLQRLLKLFPELAYVLVRDNRIDGYILGRAGESWLSAGPWVARLSAEDALILLSCLAMRANGRPISIGILDVNRRACELVQSLGFVSRSDSPWRMALGKSTDLGVSPLCYAIGSAAKG